jgi:hypothetical protein
VFPPSETLGRNFMAAQENILHVNEDAASAELVNRQRNDVGIVDTSCLRHNTYVVEARLTRRRRIGLRSGTPKLAGA